MSSAHQPDSFARPWTQAKRADWLEGWRRAGAMLLLRFVGRPAPLLRGAAGRHEIRPIELSLSTKARRSVVQNSCPQCPGPIYLCDGGFLSQRSDMVVRKDAAVSETLNRRGNSLLKEARSKQGREADDLFRAACATYAEALKLQPDMGAALVGLGCPAWRLPVEPSTSSSARTCLRSPARRCLRPSSYRPRPPPTTWPAPVPSTSTSVGVGGGWRSRRPTFISHPKGKCLPTPILPSCATSHGLGSFSASRSATDLTATTRPFPVLRRLSRVTRAHRGGAIFRPLRTRFAADP